MIPLVIIEFSIRVLTPRETSGPTIALMISQLSAI